MKKLFVLLAALMFISNVAFAQTEVGIRLGDGSGGNAAIDGIISIGSWSRVHADLSFGSGVGIDLIWDFIYKPLGGEAFNWYAGVGPYAVIDDPFTLGIAGELGLQYNFKFPMSLSVDWRPAFRIIENTDFSAGGFGFNIRYVF